MRIFLLIFLATTALVGQDYFTERYQPFQPSIPSPETFLEYDLGQPHSLEQKRDRFDFEHKCD